MKLDMKKLFDSPDLGWQIPTESIAVPTDKERNERIKNAVLSKINAAQKPHKTRRFGRLIAVAAVVALFISTVSVGAMNHFKPANALNQMIEYNSKVDYSTLGTVVNQTAESDGLEFYLGEVLCDNSIMMIPIKCPQYKGRYVQPKTNPLGNDSVEDDGQSLRLYINGKEGFGGIGSSNGGRNDNIHFDEAKQDMFYLTVTEIENIRDNSKIKLTFNELQFFDLENDNDVCDAKGEWSFEFTINRSKTRTQLEGQDFELENGEHYHVKNIIISPLGLHVDYKLTYHGQTHSMHTLFSQNIACTLSGTPMVKITMKDDTVYTDGEPDNAMVTNCGSERRDSWDYECGQLDSVFNHAIDVENIQSITVLDYVVYQA